VFLRAAPGLVPAFARQLVPAKGGQVFRRAIVSIREERQNARKQGLSMMSEVGPEIALKTAALKFNGSNKE
tara:strand:- start:78 stop:290 length:213 start_codon:yes stop_codon:yes gene_type:complete